MKQNVTAKEPKYWSFEELMAELSNLQHVEVDWLGRKIPVNFMWLTADDNMPIFSPDKISSIQSDIDKEKMEKDEKYRDEMQRKFESMALVSFFDPKHLKSRAWAMIDKANKVIQTDPALKEQYGSQVWTEDLWNKLPDVLQMNIINLMLGAKQRF